VSRLVVVAPLAGWAGPLDEVDDAVFASRMLGDGIAIDPTEGILRAPCDGEVTALPQSAHAVTIRALNGAELLLHVGIDTVALKGEGFAAQVPVGARVTAGQPLIHFDVDRVARGARSLMTPVVVTEPERFRIIERRPPGRLRAGDVIMELLADLPSSQASAATGAAVTGTLRVTPEHGLHARPAAILVQALRNLRADVTFSLRGRRANARSAVAVLALGARRGDALAVEAVGADAARVAAALEAAMARAAAEPHEAGDAASAGTAGSAEVPAGTPLVASPGIAVGPAVRIVRGEPALQEQGAGADTETRHFDDARRRLGARLGKLAAGGGEARAGIVAAHLEFLEDPELLAGTYRGIAAGRSAAWAWREAVNEGIRLLGALEDSRLAARADDLRDLELQLLELLAGAAPPAALALPAGAILVARELLPSQFLALDAARIGGLCTVSRASTSHVAILAGALGLPMLAGVDDALLAVADGTTLLLDAERGTVTVAPPPAEIADAGVRIAARARARARMKSHAAEDARTADGERIEVFANVGSVAEAAAAVASGAEGCGLLRTEFLFLDREQAPEAAEQARCYQEIVDAFAGRPVVIRTLDAGGDKPMPFLPMPPQDNPALGLRGIRASLWRPELLRTQLAAILSVRPRGRCRILLPMVNDAAEIEAVRHLLRELAPGLGADPEIPVGVMIETPAAAVGAARLARHADFLSIGTNDLTQYVLAIDRGHPLLADRLDPLHPAVLGLIAGVAASARAAGRGVAVCGGLASDPDAAPLLAGLGVAELSAVPGAIPELKDALRRRTMTECRELAARALAQDGAVAVRTLMTGARP
jgi:phosphocarrier protein FPr/phosphocarrier protein